MNFYVVPQKSLVVGWSEKCACTTVCDWLVNGVIQLDGPLKKKQREYLTDNNYLRSPKEALAMVNNKGFTPILFTRNPFTRMESAFLSKFVYRGGKPLNNESLLEPFALKAAKDCYAISGYDGEYKGVSLVELLNYVKHNISKNKRVDGHWAPQILNNQISFNEKGQFTNLKEQLAEILNGRRFLVRQESFNHDIKNVNSALGFSYVPAYKNATTAPPEWGKAQQEADFGKMTSGEIINAKINMPKKMVLTHEVNALIREIYLDDFKLFSYPIPRR